MENLTKENFWNEMKEKYPLSVGAFCEWIDQYKEENGWVRLFNGGITTHLDSDDKQPVLSTVPKYHELPLAMQIGIFTQWNGSRYYSNHTDAVFHDESKKIIIDAFTRLEQAYGTESNTAADRSLNDSSL